MSEEKYVFPSEEWIQKYMELLNANEAYADAAATWEGDFIFEVTADGTVIEEPIRFYLDLWHGKCREAFAIPEGEEKESVFIYSGPYENWRKLLANEIDPVQGLMMGKFKLVGDMAKVMRAVKAAQELVRCTTMIDTSFEGLPDLD